MTIPTAATIIPQGAHAGQFTLLIHGTDGLWITSLMNQVDVGQRLGQSGNVAQTIGQVGRLVNAKGWWGDYLAANVITYIQNWESLEGEVCQILDGWGRTIPRVRLTNMVATPRGTRGPLLFGTTQVTIRTELSFTCQRLPNS